MARTALLRLEKHYSEALEHVRALISLESDIATPVAELTKGDAAAIVMGENGERMHRNELLLVMRERKHPIASLKALGVTLSCDDRFESVGCGFWRLAKIKLAPSRSAL